MSRRNIKKITREPDSYGKTSQEFPKVTLRTNNTNQIQQGQQNIIRRPRRNRQNISNARFLRQTTKPIEFLTEEFKNINKDVCFVVGGGPSLCGFDFSQLNGFDTIAINKSVEFIQNPTYFVTTDYTYFKKASLPIEKINQKVQKSYFIVNMSYKYMEHSNGYVTDTRANMTYDDLYKYDSVISSTNKIGFGTTLQEFSHGDNSGHCGIQLALLLGYKKIYLLGFDMTAGNVTHFHQSYKPGDQESFKRKVPDYAQSLLTSLKNYQGSQEIINLSAESILAQQHSNVIKTQIFANVMNEHGVSESTNTTNATLDNLMVVGYYTVNTPYEEEAKTLLQSLKKLSINHDISGVNTLGNWQANTRFKASFMLDMLIKWPNHRLLYVDVDAVVHKLPDLFENYYCDIAVRWQDFKWRKNECLSGTIYMENNERTKRICELWRDINIAEGNQSSRMEQWNLDTVINQLKSEDPQFTYKNLPPEYTMIFDSMRGMYPNIVPIIEHFQASRRFKKDVNN